MVLLNLTDKIEIFGIIYSLILLTGLYQIGDLIFKIKNIKIIFNQISDVKYQKIFLSINLILLIFYPLILYLDKINFIPILSVSLLLLGIFKILNKFKKKFKIFQFKYDKDFIDKYLALFTISILFLLSLAPNTHGDSLGYHFVVAKKILSSEGYFSTLTHFHSLLAGSGEIMIAIGLFFGSEQFGNLVQFSGLISIFGIFKKINNNNKYYYLLLVLTSPIILFLSSTSKPQLFHICSSAVIFSLYFIGNSKNLTVNDEKWKIIISLIILLVSVNSKFNFILSSTLLGCYIFYISIKNNNYKFFLYSSILILSIFYFSVIYWKYLNFGGSFFQYLYSPVPLNIHGLEEFKQYLTRYGRETNYLNIFIPKNFNQFTNSIGIAFFYLFLLNFKEKKVQIVFAIILFYLLIYYLFGQFIGRSFLEPLFWILLITAKYGPSIKLKIFEYFCRLQAIIVIAGILFGVFTILPGAFTKYYKDKVLSKNANGYSLFKWANTKLKKEDVLFSTHKSISLGKSKFIPTDFLPYVDFNNKDSNIITDEIMNKKPKFLLTFSFNNGKPILSKFENCVGSLLYQENLIGKYEARNPFNRGNKYNGFIYEFNLAEFPQCMKTE